MDKKTWLKRATVSVIVLLLCAFFSTAGGALFARSETTPYYAQADLAEINHPDLFKHHWSHSARTQTAPTTPQTPTPTPKATMNINRPIRGTPIPLDQLDSSLVQRVHFDYDKVILRPETKAGIQVNTAWLKKHSEYDILLEGHGDERGTNEYNLALGERRAEAVRNYMVDLGIEASRISVRSWGEEKPLDLKQNEEAYAVNRRVEFYAVPLQGSGNP